MTLRHHDALACESRPMRCCRCYLPPDGLTEALGARAGFIDVAALAQRLPGDTILSNMLLLPGCAWQRGRIPVRRASLATVRSRAPAYGPPCASASVASSYEGIGAFARGA